MHTEGIFDHTSLGAIEDELDELSEEPGFDLFAGERISVPEQIAAPADHMLPIRPVVHPVTPPEHQTKADAASPMEQSSNGWFDGLTSNQKIALAVAVGIGAALLVRHMR